MPKTPIEYLVSGSIFGDYYIREITLNDAPMEMGEIAKLLNSDKITITNIDYEDTNFLVRKYLIISYEKVIKTDTGRIEVGDFTLSIANVCNIPLNMIVRQMSHYDVFMRYFMRRLKRNIPEIIIHNDLEPY